MGWKDLFKGDKAEKESMQSLEEFVNGLNTDELLVNTESGTHIVESKFAEKRLTFNVLAISALLGVSFKKSDDGNWEVTNINKSKLTKGELLKATRLINEYIMTETAIIIMSDNDEFFKKATTNKVGKASELEISTKNFQKLITEKITSMLTLNDFMELTEYGELLAKKRKNRMILVASISAALAAIATGGYLYYNSQKDKEDGEVAEESEIETTTDSDEIVSVDDLGSDITVTVDEDDAVVTVEDDEVTSVHVA